MAAWHPRRLDLTPSELDWAASHMHLLDCQIRELSAGMQRLQQVYNDLMYRTMRLERHMGWIRQHNKCVKVVMGPEVIQLNELDD